MKEIEILGANRFESYSKTRVGCRGIVIENGKMLVSREEISDWWLIPGGGLEPNETLAECCKREILEETGYIVEPTEEFLVMNEYYEEYRYISHYFICQVMGKGKQMLTEYEKRRGLVPAWVEIPFFLDIVSKHQDYALVSEEKRGSYLREYTAIKEYLNIVQK
jgi:ADP-ribose pyrophosphatase YjhB (NUDIX family)